MGCDIHIVAERQTADGWERMHVPVTVGDEHDDDVFNWRQYGMFAFFAGVRNRYDIPPISEPRGKPDDFRWWNFDLWNDGDDSGFDDINEDLHSVSWLSIKELEDFDYDAEILLTEDETADEIVCSVTTYREFLGEYYFAALQAAAQAGVERIVFGFDN